MARKKTSLLGFAFLGIIAIVFFIIDLIKENLAVSIGIGVAIVGIIFFLFVRKNKKREEPLDAEIDPEIISRLPREALHNLKNALNKELAKDFLGARMHFMQCMERMRHLKNTPDYETVGKLYENFVSRDPVFHKLAEGLIKGINLNPGILQSEITKQLDPLETWGYIQYHNRKISRDDIYYALYFMDKFGYITRIKKGRSYQLHPKEDAAVEGALR